MPELSGTPQVLSLDLDDRDELLGRLAEDFERKLRAGESPRIASYQADHPDLAVDIIELFTTIATLEGMKSEVVRDSDGCVSLAGAELHQLGEFRIEREISRGGMGIVFEAEQTSLNRRVALKVLPRQMLPDDHDKAQFEREATLAASLHHSNIVPVYGCGFEDGYHFYAMQLIAGSTPGTTSEAQRDAASAWTARHLAEVGLQVADALEYAHQQGVLHRDIKPSNLIEDEQGRVWITDFGLAGSSSSDLNTGRHGGTEKYLAPERADGICNAATDVYGLGITLRELAARENLRLPPDLDAVIQKACSTDPSARYARASDLADDLRRFLSHYPVRARRLSWAGRFTKMIRRNPALSAALGLVFGLAWGTAFMFHQSYQKSEQQNKRISRALFAVDALLWSNTAGTEQVNDSLPHRDMPPLKAPERSPMLKHFFPDTELDLLIRTSPELLLTLTQSRRQVGLAQKQLGNLNEARLALQYSLDEVNRVRRTSVTTGHSPVDPSQAVLLAARLNNDLGDIAELQMQFATADAHRHTALSLLAEEPEADENGPASLEEGRAHLGLGAYRSERTGLFASWSELEETPDETDDRAVGDSAHLDDAVRCMQTGRRLDNSPDSVMLLARAHLEQALLRRATGRSWQEDDQRAVSLLSDMFREHPTHPDCRHLLAIALANLPLQPKAADRLDPHEHRRRLERSLELAYSLTRSHPQHTSYVETDIDIRHKLAELNVQEGQGESANEQLRLAISHQKFLIHRFPLRLRFRIRQGLLKWRMTELMVQTGRTEPLRRFQFRARRQFEFLPKSQENEPAVVAARDVLDGKRSLAAIPALDPIAVSDNDVR